MWNLGALAAKAQEAAAKAQAAAARIEKQLDNSVGLDTGGAAAESSLTATHDDLDDDDDFFSSEDNHGQQWNDNDAEAVEGDGILDVTADEGNDFFGDDDDPSPPMPQQNIDERKSSENLDEEVDFDDDDVGGDGWDDVDEIPLDDDEDEIPVPVPVQHEEPQHEESEDVHEKEPSILQEPEPIKTEDTDANLQAFETSPDAQRNDIGPAEDISNDNGIEQSERNETESELLVEPNIFADQSPEIISEANAAEEETNDNIQEDDVKDENQLQNDEPHASPTDSIPEPQPHITNAPSMDDAEKQQYLSTIAQLESQLYQREDQLASKSDQITSLSLQYESETTQLRTVISETKEEAKKRVMRANDRVKEIQNKLTEAVRRADAVGGSSQGQSEMIAALRAEGEQLARKQSTMEQSVRSARGEARELQEQLDIEKDSREKEVDKVESLEKEVKSLKEGLSLARKGESQSKKLEGELVAAKEESEKHRASNLGLDQKLKELKLENKSLKKEAGEARDGAALELEGESNKLRRERDDMLSDLESKLRTSDREANVREDALRHEVSELRKRWQDAVRRAEDLSMDVQHSTAPLLRQLESTERQSRTRASAWAELETKLRSDLEDHVIQLEKLTKARNDLIASDKRSQRLVKEKEEDITSSHETIDELSATIETLETKVEELEDERKKIRQELVVAERKASEGASKVRNEMMQTVVNSEERYQSQIETLEEELDGERQLRGKLEKQLDDLAESVAAAEFVHDQGEGGQHSPAKEKKLLSATNQASILQDTLAGFDSDDDEGDENGMDHLQGQGSSFAAMEQLSLGLKGAKVELEALRKQLASSEETRESLLEELGGARQAVEKLPLFEQKVDDLTMEVKLKEMEIQGLQDDIADVRFLYRTQLDVLLEEKASTHSSSMQLEEDEEKKVMSMGDDSS